jgi:hypothetical protein
VGDPEGQRHRLCPAADRAVSACDFFTIDLLDGTQDYVLTVIEHATHRIRIPGVTLHPTGEWTTQQARNLLMDLGDQADRVKFMIRDRGVNFTAAFDAVLAAAGVRTVLCNVRTPRMNAITVRWIGGWAASSWTAPSSGIRPTCCGYCATTKPTQSAPASPLPGCSCAAENPHPPRHQGRHVRHGRAAPGDDAAH